MITADQREFAAVRTNFDKVATVEVIDQSVTSDESTTSNTNSVIGVRHIDDCICFIGVKLNVQPDEKAIVSVRETHGMIITYRVMKSLTGVLVSVPRLKVDVGDQIDLKPLSGKFLQDMPIRCSDLGHVWKKDEATPPPFLSTI